MNADALSALFETAPGANLRMDQLMSVLGADSLATFDSSWLIELPISDDVLCTACGDTHTVRVLWDVLRHMHGGYCADGGGWFAVATDARRRFRFRHERLLDVLGRGFSLSGKSEELAPSACWLLGVATIGEAERDVVVARELNDPRRLMEVAGALRRKRKSWSGIILTGARPMVDIGVLPRGLKIVELRDIIALDHGGEVAIDFTRAGARLGWTGAGRGEHGAPRAHPQLVPYIKERLSSGRALASDTAEARHVLADTTWATPGASIPELDAVRMAVVRLRKELG